MLHARLALVLAIAPLGAGAQERAIDDVDVEEIDVGAARNAALLLRGRVAGVEVIEDPAPGGGVGIRIRGISSLLGNEPLYVVDGMPLPYGGGATAGSNPIDFLDVHDVQRVRVIKGAAALARYGARGGHGVIEIETRSGGRPGFAYTGSMSATSALDAPELLDADQFRDLVAAYDAEHGTNHTSRLGDASTDWHDALRRTGIGHAHALAFAGGEAGRDYRVSIGYLNQPGAIERSGFERATLGAALEQRLPGDALRFRGSLHAGHVGLTAVPWYAFPAASVMAPTQPIRDADGDFFEWDEGFGVVNPVSMIAATDDEGTTRRVLTLLEADYAFPGSNPLGLQLRAGYDGTHLDRETAFSAPLAPGEPVHRMVGDATGIHFEAVLRHQRAIAALELDAHLGVARQTTDTDIEFTTDPSAGGGFGWRIFEDGALHSAFAGVDASLLGRYDLTLGVRMDAMASGASDCCERPDDAEFYPSASVEWNVADEPFLRGASAPSTLTLRGSYGRSGTEAFGRLSHYENADLGRTSSRFQTVWLAPALLPMAEGFEREIVTAVDAGIDIGFAQDRVLASFEIYERTTDNLMLGGSFGGPFGFAWNDVGTLRSRGVDAGVDVRIAPGSDGGFEWTGGFVASWQSTEITQLDVGAALFGPISGGFGNQIQIVREGDDPFSFFVYESRADNPDFLDLDDDGDVDAGDLYVDRNVDGIINEEDRRAFGSPRPDWILGHTSRIRWRALDAGVALVAHLGNSVYNDGAASTGFLQRLDLSGVPVNLHRSVLETGFHAPQYLSDYYVEDASFLRIDHVTLGWSVNANVRVHGTVRNALTRTEYRGVDPVAGSSGIDYDYYPRMRTFIVGTNLSF